MLELGVVDQDHHVPAIELKGMFNAVAANAQTFETTPFPDEASAILPDSPLAEPALEMLTV